MVESHGHDEGPGEFEVGSSGQARLLAVSVGNTTTRFGAFEGSQLLRSGRVPNALGPRVAEQIRAEIALLWENADEDDGGVVVASVNEPVAGPLVRELSKSGPSVYRLGVDVAIPIRTALLPDATPGQDRLLNALAAYHRLKQACVVVDAGTAVTVDFVDGQGVFQGGAIAPGAMMQLAALHEKTAALPQVHLAGPPAEAYGRDTTQAMLNGVYWGIRGLVRQLVERYAEAYEAFPLVVATGGDAALLFEGEDLIDRVVPELTLLGIETACRLNLLAEDEDDEDDLPGS